MKIAIIGTGYVGLVSGACFAELGLNVTCIDKDKNKIKALHKGKIPIFEPGLEKVVKTNVDTGRLQFETSLENSVRNADAVFIAVGTPPDGYAGGADLSYVYGAARDIVGFLEDGAVVVTKSTVPVGTGDRVRSIISEIRPELKFDVASNPEFLREGCAVKDFLEPDRVIVGTDSDTARRTLEVIYKPLINKDVPVLWVDVKTAELTKYAANAFLATKIALINEIADICEHVGANIEQVALGMGTDHRIGSNYLMPGPGYGGSCFPKDTLALRKIARGAGTQTRIVESVIESNDTRKLNMVRKIIDASGGNLEGKVVAILGLAFKANTDDMRESPALVIMSELDKAGAKLRAYDPEAMEQAQELFNIKGVSWCKDAYEAMQNVDITVIITEWDDFRNLDLVRSKDLMKSPIVVDLRNLYSRELMESKGFTYISIGR